MSEPREHELDHSPWLSVSIRHDYGSVGAGFHLSVNFQADARRTVIFGPSGSGKSSILRAVAGLMQPESGRIAIHGRTVWERSSDAPRRLLHNIPVEHRRIGLVMQTPAVFPHLTVSGNVAYALRHLDRQERVIKVASLLEMLEAVPFADRWPRNLSGGQLQRVAIARALAADPSVLLLDEPFSALDSRSRTTLSANVHAWARARRVPILTVTHNLEEAFAAGDEVIAMQDGSIVAQGSPHDVLAEERHRLLSAMGAAARDQAPATPHAPAT